MAIAEFCKIVRWVLNHRSGCNLHSLRINHSGNHCPVPLRMCSQRTSQKPSNVEVEQQRFDPNCAISHLTHQFRYVRHCFMPFAK